MSETRIVAVLVAAVIALSACNDDGDGESPMAGCPGDRASPCMPQCQSFWVSTT